MVQGFKRSTGPKKVTPSKSSSQKKLMKATKYTKKGSSVKMPKGGRFYESAVEDRDLSKAIDKANEKKVAAKLIQSGGKISTIDIKAGGKEFSKEQRRQQVKRKLTRVEEKLKELQAKDNK